MSHRLHLLQCKPKRAAQIGGAAHGDGLVVGFHDVLHDGQPQAGAALFARATFVDAVKAIENVLELVGGNTDTVVGHFDEDVAVHVVIAYFGTAVGDAVFDGVAHQVRQYLTDALAVGAHAAHLTHAVFKFEADVFAAGLELEVFKHLLCQFPEVESLQFEHQLAGFVFGNRFQVFHNGREAIQIFCGPFQIGAVHGGVFQRAVEQGVQKALDIENRGFEFVRDVAHKAPAVLGPGFVFVQFFLLILRPGLHFLRHVVQQRTIHIYVHAFVFGGQFLLPDDFINDLDFAVDVHFEVKRGSKIGRKKRAGDHTNEAQPERNQLADDQKQRKNQQEHRRNGDRNIEADIFRSRIFEHLKLEFVADAFDGFDVVVAYFFAQFANVYVYGAVAYNDVGAPYFAENFLAGEHLARLRGQQR